MGQWFSITLSELWVEYFIANYHSEVFSPVLKACVFVWNSGFLRRQPQKRLRDREQQGSLGELPSWTLIWRIWLNSVFNYPSLRGAVGDCHSVLSVGCEPSACTSGALSGDPCKKGKKSFSLSLLSTLSLSHAHTHCPLYSNSIFFFSWFHMLTVAA